MRAAEHSPCSPRRLLVRRHGFAEVVERGVGVPAERRRVNRSHPERDVITLSENASRHGHEFAQQRLGFFEALKTIKGRRVVAARCESYFMFLAKDLRISGVYVSH